MGRARPEVGSRCRVCSGPRAGRLRRALTGKGRSKRRRTRSCRGPRGPAPFSLSCPTTLHRQVPRKSLSPSAGCGWAFCCLQEEESCLIVTGQWATGVTAQESLLMDVPDMQTGWTARAGSVRGGPRRSLLCSTDGLPALITSTRLCLSLLLLLPHFLCCLEYTWEPGGLAP